MRLGWRSLGGRGEMVVESKHEDEEEIGAHARRLALGIIGVFGHRPGQQAMRECFDRSLDFKTGTGSMETVAIVKVCGTQGTHLVV